MLGDSPLFPHPLPTLSGSAFYSSIMSNKQHEASHAFIESFKADFGMTFRVAQV